MPPGWALYSYSTAHKTLTLSRMRGAVQDNYSAWQKTDAGWEKAIRERSRSSPPGKSEETREESRERETPTERTSIGIRNDEQERWRCGRDEWGERG